MLVLCSNGPWICIKKKNILFTKKIYIFLFYLPKVSNNKHYFSTFAIVREIHFFKYIPCASRGALLYKFLFLVDTL